MPEGDIRVKRVVNQPAVENLAGKAVMPTEGDIGFRNEIHQKAFVIAGLTDEAILKDVQKLLTKAMEKGIPFEQFQRDFKKTIEGRWLPTSKTGEPNTGWRARIIYHTNMRMAYSEARRKALEKKKITHPYWQWRIGPAKVHRQDHVMRDGMILSADDPWWNDHFPPDGYGCNCFVDAISSLTMEELGKVDENGNIVPDTPPPDAVKKPKPGEAFPESASGVDPTQTVTTTPNGDKPASAMVQEVVRPEITQTDMPPEIAPSDLNQTIDEVKQEAAKAKAEDQRIKEYVAEMVVRAKEAILNKLNEDDAKRFKEALEAMTLATNDPIRLGELPDNVFGRCRTASGWNSQTPEAKYYKEIIFNKKFVKKCFVSKTISGGDTYGFYIDPKTLKEIGIPGEARMQKLALHELGHLVHWKHNEAHDKLVYDCMCELIPDYQSWHRVLEHRKDVYPWKGRPNQTGEWAWKLSIKRWLMRLMEKLQH